MGSVEIQVSVISAQQEQSQQYVAKEVLSMEEEQQSI